MIMRLDLNTIINMTSYEKEEILDNIHKYRNTEDIINALKNDPESLVRNKVAEVLANDYLHKDAVFLLKRLSTDKDYLVRTSAVESLENYCDEGVYDFIKVILNKEKNLLAKTYAITSLCNLGVHFNKQDEIRSILENILMTEKRTYCKTYCYYFLIVMGHSKYIDCIISNINARNYRTQIAVANCLANLVLDENLSNEENDLVINKLTKKSKRKNCLSVQETFDRALQRIREKYNADN